MFECILIKDEVVFGKAIASFGVNEDNEKEIEVTLMNGNVYLLSPMESYELLLSVPARYIKSDKLKAIREGRFL